MKGDSVELVSGQAKVSRIVYLFVLLIAAYYIARLPAFVAGYYRNQVIPGFPILTNNPIGLLAGAFWLSGDRKLKDAFKVGYSVLALVASIVMTHFYLRIQPGYSLAVLEVTMYFFSSTLLLMPWIVIFGCEHAERLGPKLFKAW